MILLVTVADADWVSRRDLGLVDFCGFNIQYDN